VSYLLFAIGIICKYEGFNEKAYPDPNTSEEPYTIGYGTQYYPDGTAVKKGQYCTKEKALEYVTDEVNRIDKQLECLNLHLDDSMRAALVSFIHSIGWKPFLYSNVLDCLQQEYWRGAVDGMSQWVLDGNYEVVGSLLERRREEVEVFMKVLELDSEVAGRTLLASFEKYSGTLEQVRAIEKLESRINPYILAEFANEFKIVSEI
jgi:GH24 family phage-related lysozyme (muramidase)